MPQSEIYNIDCNIGMKKYPDKYFDLACVDPPYGINSPKMQMGYAPNRNEKSQYPSKQKTKGRLNSGGGKLKNRILNQSDIDWDNEIPSPEYFKELFRVSKNQIIWGFNYFPLPPSRGIICWDKIQPWDNFSQIELAWTSYDFPAKLFRLSNRGGRNEKRKIHPNEKPQELYKFCYDTAGIKPGMKVLDTHLGSGNSRIVAQIMGFDFVGFETNETYYKDSIEEYDKAIFGKEKVGKINIIQSQLFNY